MAELDFDKALEALILTCEATPGWAAVERALVVRELSGRLRLVLRLPAGADDALPEALGSALGAALGAWFHGPLLCTGVGGSGARRLAEHLLELSPKAWPLGWPDALTLDPVTGAALELPGEVWSGQDALHGGHAWLSTAARERPWPITAHTPPIVAFYSFKGGVGRSTTLAVLAVQAARRGRKVVVLDLDLEAPGLTPLLLSPDADEPEASVADYLLTLAATGRPPRALPVVPVQLGGASLSLVPAGRLSPAYLQRLASLDAAGRFGEASSPVADGLRGLLKRLKKELQPDLVLIDCRTGLSDIGGAALIELSHVDVVVGRLGRADLAGAGVVLEALVRRVGPEASFMTVVSMVHELESAEGGQHRVRLHRAALYDKLEEVGALQRDADGSLPSFDDALSPHFARPTPYDRELAQLVWLGEAPERLWSDASYAAILDRIDALASPGGAE